MGVLILSVTPGSPAESAGIKAGEQIVSINRHLISDVLDYRFYMTERRLRIGLVSDSGSERTVRLRKGEYEELGLEFATYLMDRQHTCKNKCIFCFVDQTPPGMRETLYFKDDDERLSFLFGNYVTLTNLSREEIDRIVRMRVSPINVSVHTMNPELRVSMMANPSAGQVLSYLKILADGGIALNVQLVLCPGINDRDELRKTMDELAKLLPAVQSVAAVPVGLTRYREGLYPLEPFSRLGALETISILHEYAESWQHEWEERIVYPSDEFFLLAELPIPPYPYYGEFPQLDNGVGLLAMLEYEFFEALEGAAEETEPRQLSIATGAAAYPLISHLCEAAMLQIRGLKITPYKIENVFFGPLVTVAGLLTGQDIQAQLAGKALGSALLLPQVTLRHEQDRLLDDMPIELLATALGTDIIPVPNDGFVLLDKMLGL